MSSMPAEPFASVSGSPGGVDPNDVAAVAAEWARQVVKPTCTSASQGYNEEFFLGLLHRLIDALRSAPFSALPAGSIGADLVRAHINTPESVRGTIESLTVPLLRLAESLDVPDAPERAVAVLSALAEGHAAAIRDWILQRQEDTRNALLRATRLDWERSEARFREVFVRSAFGIAISAAGGELSHVNPALSQMLGYAAERLVGRTLRDFLPPEDVTNLESEYWDLVRGHDEPFRTRCRLVRADGQIIWVRLVVSTLHEPESAPARQLIMIEDVSDLHLLQGRMSYQSLHDGLTSLPNRQYLISRLAGLLGTAEPGAYVTLYHLDLDGFAVVNDGLGVEVGDQMLGIVARRLEALFADGDALVARLGGDEFAVLVRSATARPNVISTIDRINEDLSEPVHFEGHGGVSVSASFGVAHCSIRELDPPELLRAADITLRRAQASGKRQWAIYDPIRDRQDRRRLRLAAALPGALEFGELSLVWRPWVTLSGEKIFAVEARWHWDHAEHGVIGHDQCADVAEETGVSLAIGGWALRTACARYQAWRERFGEATPPVVVGLASQQTNDPDLASRIYDALTEVEMPPGELWVGIPATALYVPGGEARDNVDVLTGMGVRVLLTDVGSAPRDLLHVEECAPNAIAVADWLVKRVRTSGAESALPEAARSLVRAAKSAGADVMVADVSTREQVDWWREAGATVMCGAMAATRTDTRTDTDGMTDFLAARLG